MRTRRAALLCAWTGWRRPLIPDVVADPGACLVQLSLAREPPASGPRQTAHTPGSPLAARPASASGCAGGLTALARGGRDIEVDLPHDDRAQGRRHEARDADARHVAAAAAVVRKCEVPGTASAPSARWCPHLRARRYRGGVAHEQITCALPRQPKTSVFEAWLPSGTAPQDTRPSELRALTRLPSASALARERIHRRLRRPRVSATLDDPGTASKSARVWHASSTCVRSSLVQRQ